MKSLLLFICFLIVLIALVSVLVDYIAERLPPALNMQHSVPADARCIENYCEQPADVTVDEDQCFDCWTADFEHLLDGLERVFQAASVQ